MITWLSLTIFESIIRIPAKNSSSSIRANGSLRIMGILVSVDINSAMPSLAIKLISAILASEYGCFCDELVVGCNTNCSSQWIFWNDRVVSLIICATNAFSSFDQEVLLSPDILVSSVRARSSDCFRLLKRAISRSTVSSSY